MFFNYDKLRGLIREKFKTQDSFAEALKIGRVSLSQRLNNRLQFSQSEIILSCSLLDIEQKDIITYFFNTIVQKDEQKYLKKEVIS